MIKTFRHKGLQYFYERESKAGITVAHAIRLKDILASLDAAEAVSDLGAPGLRLHPLKGKQKGHWSVSVTGAWRVTFRFEGGNAFDVNYLQYH